MVRKIEYTVTESGIAPAVTQFGGVQGEHRATELSFHIDNVLWGKLKTLVENGGGSLIYRFDGFDGEGGVHRSDTNALSGEYVSYFLEEKLTRYGGTVRAVLIISWLKSNTTELELYSFPAALKLKGVPMGTESEENNRESMTALAEATKYNATVAKYASATAVDAMERTENARAALENGTVWIFDGGDSESEVGVEFVVDGAMSSTSNNAVANKVIKAYVDDNFAVLADYPIEIGTKEVTQENGIIVYWTYRIWKSKLIECWGNANKLTAAINNNQDDKHFNRIELPNAPLSGITCRYSILNDQSVTDSTAWKVEKSFISAYNEYFVDIVIYSETTTAENISLSLKVEGKLSNE